MSVAASLALVRRRGSCARVADAIAATRNFFIPCAAGRRCTVGPWACRVSQRSARRGAGGCRGCITSSSSTLAGRRRRARRRARRHSRFVRTASWSPAITFSRRLTEQCDEREATRTTQLLQRPAPAGGGYQVWSRTTTSALRPLAQPLPLHAGIAERFDVYAIKDQGAVRVTPGARDRSSGARDHPARRAERRRGRRQITPTKGRCDGPYLTIRYQERSWWRSKMPSCSVGRPWIRSGGMGWPGRILDRRGAGAERRTTRTKQRGRIPLACLTLAEGVRQHRCGRSGCATLHRRRIG